MKFFIWNMYGHGRVKISDHFHRVSHAILDVIPAIKLTIFFGKMKIYIFCYMSYLKNCSLLHYQVQIGRMSCLQIVCAPDKTQNSSSIICLTYIRSQFISMNLQRWDFHAYCLLHVHFPL